MARVTYCTQLFWVLLNSFCVQNLPVILANLEVFAVMVCQDDLLLKVTELEICDIVIHLHRRLIGRTSLLPLFGLLFELLNLLGGLLWLAVEVPLVDLTAENLGLGPVSALDAQRDLLQDEFCLFASRH
jgi:hypothetical protein